MAKPAATKPSPTIPTLQEFRAFAAEFGFDPQEVLDCWRYYRVRGWRFSSGDPILEYDQLVILSAWVRNGMMRRTRPSN